jgi:hypothetical protein
MRAISLGSEQSLLPVRWSSFKFFMRNNSDGTSVRPMCSSWRRCVRAERMCKSSTHVDVFSVVLETFLDDAFCRLAAKNQLSH